MTDKRWQIFLVASVLYPWMLLGTARDAQAAMIDSYLAPDKSEYKYASGFGDDHIIPGWTTIDFSGAITDNSDKYLSDAIALGGWARQGTGLGCYSSTPTDIVYKVSMPDEGAAGYVINNGEIHVLTRMYAVGGKVELFISKDNVNWSTALMADAVSVQGWVFTAHDIAIPGNYLGGDTIYVKFTGNTPSANGWAVLYQWGIRTDLALVPEPATMGLLLVGLPLALRRRKRQG